MVCCVRLSFAAATIFMDLVILRVLSTLRIRVRMALTLAMLLPPFSFFSIRSAEIRRVAADHLAQTRQLIALKLSA